MEALKEGVFMETIHIRMLGEFSLSCGSITISDTSSRSRKVWGLLAYLICSRERSISQKELMEQFWNGNDNPENALRIALHRLRSLLDRLFPDAGRTLIWSRDGQCGWNREYPITLDSQRFEELSVSDAKEPEARLAQLLEALELYRGEFLPRLSSEVWAISSCAHFENRFLQVTLEAAGLLLERKDYTLAEALCKKAIQAEPYHEGLHQMLLRVCLAAGDSKSAAAVYEAFRKRLFTEFGIHPNEETRQLYLACVPGTADRLLPMEEVLAHLQEPEGVHGAMRCDYESFKLLCYAEARDMPRSGNTTHIALINVTGTADHALSSRSRERIMEQLGEVLRLDLHRGDILSRCSSAQYILMLPGADFENSCMICRRGIAAFFRVHPHVSAQLHFMVQPLTPNVSVP